MATLMYKDLNESVPFSDTSICFYGGADTVTLTDLVLCTCANTRHESIVTKRNWCHEIYGLKPMLLKVVS